MLHSFARFRVDQTPNSFAGFDLPHAVGRARSGKGGESIVTFADLYTYLHARFAREEGQTMAEYGVVLAVITIGVFLALGLLSGAISSAISTVTGYL